MYVSHHKTLRKYKNFIDCFIASEYLYKISLIVLKVRLFFFVRTDSYRVKSGFIVLFQI